MLFHLSPKDNDSYMVGSCDRVDPASKVPVCGACGYRTDPDFTSAVFQLRNRRFDISSCYDGAVIVSDRFVALYRSLVGSNMSFAVLPTAPGFHHLKCRQPVALDYSAMGTRFTRPCAGCDRYLDTIGYGAITLKPEADVGVHDMAFSDRYFGSNNEASPLVLCGPELAGALRASGLTGVASCEVVDA